MRKENSYGIIPLRYQRNRWEVLLVQHVSGHWAFPKGHSNPGELPLQAAERELKEETNLKIEEILSHTPFIETYIFTFKGDKILKTVHYFPAKVLGEVVIEEKEIKECIWLPLDKAYKKITFEEGRKVCNQTIELLKAVKE